MYHDWISVFETPFNSFWKHQNHPTTFNCYFCLQFSFLLLLKWLLFVSLGGQTNQRQKLKYGKGCSDNNMLMPKNEKKCISADSYCTKFCLPQHSQRSKFFAPFLQTWNQQLSNFNKQTYSTAYKQFKIQYCSKTFQKRAFTLPTQLIKKKKRNYRSHKSIGQLVEQ